MSKIFDHNATITEQVKDYAAEMLSIPSLNAKQLLEEEDLTTLFQNICKDRIPDAPYDFWDRRWMFLYLIEELNLASSAWDVFDNTIKEYLFEDCPCLASSIEIPSKIQYIDWDAFCISHPSYTPKLKHLQLSEGLKSIGPHAFCGQPIEELIIPDGTRLEPGALQSMTYLKKLRLPSDLKILPTDLLWCTQIEEIQLPSTLEQVGNYVFNGCRNLKEVKIPQSVQSIDDEAFGGYYGLVYLPKKFKAPGIGKKLGTALSRIKWY